LLQFGANINQRSIKEISVSIVKEISDYFSPKQVEKVPSGSTALTFAKRFNPSMIQELEQKGALE